MRCSSAPKSHYTEREPEAFDYDTKRNTFTSPRYPAMLSFE